MCQDVEIEPMEGVNLLSVTINNTLLQIHRAVAYHCGNWHVFVIVMQDSKLTPP